MTTVLEPQLDREPAPESSDRSFGLLFAGLFALVGCWPLIHWDAPRWWAVGLAAAFASVALMQPAALHPINRTWLAFSRLLHRLVSPLVMGTIFFICVTPAGRIRRLLGKDVLSLRRRTDLQSYWIERLPAPPDFETLKNQF